MGDHSYLYAVPDTTPKREYLLFITGTGIPLFWLACFRVTDLAPYLFSSQICPSIENPYFLRVPMARARVNFERGLEVLRRKFPTTDFDLRNREYLCPDHDGDDKPELGGSYLSAFRNLLYSRTEPFLEWEFSEVCNEVCGYGSRSGDYLDGFGYRLAHALLGFDFPEIRWVHNVASYREPEDLQERSWADILRFWYGCSIKETKGEEAPLFFGNHIFEIIGRGGGAPMAESPAPWQFESLKRETFYEARYGYLCL